MNTLCDGSGGVEMSSIDEQGVRLRTATDLAEWLPYRETQRMLRYLNDGDVDAVSMVLGAVFGGLPAGLDLDDAATLEAFTEALAWRVSPAIPDPDRIVTEPMENGRRVSMVRDAA